MSQDIHNTDSLLPVGSVVILKGLDQTIMIYGRMQRQLGKSILWDYVGCPYPQGFLSEDYNIFFNHNQVYQTLFKGYETETELELREKLVEKFKQ
ncbi:DUF4176 domain-containing protein [Priestia megaterium]|uniref:DUF4176 domain-containing protein n=2 Tax=Priestia megaterium TaxID=1404 RepID=UPI0004ACDDFD|nr:DUF4176 domain-containing protein [Priestia megaterium]TJZ35561.1 DUF4176 domain-containing protein [Priestia megaterium]